MPLFSQSSQVAVQVDPLAAMVGIVSIMVGVNTVVLGWLSSQVVRLGQTVAVNDSAIRGFVALPDRLTRLEAKVEAQIAVETHRLAEIVAKISNPLSTEEQGLFDQLAQRGAEYMTSRELLLMIEALDREIDAGHLRTDQLPITVRLVAILNAVLLDRRMRNAAAAGVDLL